MKTRKCRIGLPRNGPKTENLSARLVKSSGHKALKKGGFHSDVVEVFSLFAPLEIDDAVFEPAQTTRFGDWKGRNSRVLKPHEQPARKRKSIPARG